MTTRPSKFRKYVIAATTILAIGVAAIFYLIGSQPYTPARQVNFTSPSERDVIARNLEARIQQFRQSAQADHHTHETIQVTERELNAYVQSSPILQAKLQANGIATPHVQIEQGQIVANTTANVHGFSLPVTITGVVVSAPNGTKTFQINSCKVGRTSVPQAMRDKLFAAMGNANQGGGLNLPEFVSDVKIDDGKLAVTAATK